MSSYEITVTTPFGGSETDKVMKEVEQLKGDVGERIEDIKLEVREEGVAIDDIDLSKIDTGENFSQFESNLSHNLTIQGSILRGKNYQFLPNKVIRQ